MKAKSALLAFLNPIFLLFELKKSFDKFSMTTANLRLFFFSYLSLPFLFKTEKLTPWLCSGIYIFTITLKKIRSNICCAGYVQPNSLIFSKNQ